MKVGPALSPAASRALLIALWVATCLVMLALDWSFLVPLNFRDPDDALRLVQVRDLLAGQSWFDLTQYRIHPPMGVPMHWSRIVDLPIALVLAALRPFLSEDLAERVTIVAVPLAYLLGLFFIVRALAQRTGLGAGTALTACALLATSLSILIQFAPMRIDHHGAQILFGALAMLPFVSTDRPDGRMGALAGAAMAGWMQVSIEGLPYAVAMGAIIGVRFLLDARRAAGLPAYLLSLTGVSALLLFGTHYPSAAIIPWCDAMSPAWLAPLGAATAVLVVAVPLAPKKALVQRFISLGLAGAAGGAVFLLTARQCLAGPFETLDPLVYKLWFSGVMEGMPITVQKPDMQALILAPSLLGFIGTAVVLGRTSEPNHRLAWASLLLMQIAAFAVSLDVMRAMSFAHLVALPGNAALLATLMSAAQRLSLRPLRIALSAATVLLTPFGAAAATAGVLDQGKATSSQEQVADRFRCTTQANLRGLDALPAATLFAPLDIGSHILVYTHHSVVGTGHHRNVEGMAEVVHGLLAKPGAARGIVARTGARYVVFCAGENEVAKYAKAAPGSLIDMLLEGQHPAWLAPVPMRPGETIHVFRIAPTAA